MGTNGLTTITSQRNEFVKQFIELDAQSRPYKVFTAHIDCAVGAECGVTTYGYANVNSTTIIARKEELGAWTQAHEDAITAL